MADLSPCMQECINNIDLKSALILTKSEDGNSGFLIGRAIQQQQSKVVEPITRLRNLYEELNDLKRQRRQIAIDCKDCK
jgi:hypothetical protein